MHCLYDGFPAVIRWIKLLWLSFISFPVSRCWWSCLISCRMPSSVSCCSSPSSGSSRGTSGPTRTSCSTSPACRKTPQSTFRNRLNSASKVGNERVQTPNVSQQLQRFPLVRWAFEGHLKFVNKRCLPHSFSTHRHTSCFPSLPNFIRKTIRPIFLLCSSSPSLLFIIPAQRVLIFSCIFMA